MTRRNTNTKDYRPTMTTTLSRSTEMYSLNEALARDRQREYRSQARHARLARQASSERRWHRVNLSRSR